MDFPFIIFLIIGWIIFSNVKKAGKGLEKAAKTSGLGRDQISDIQARIKEARFEVQDEWDRSTPDSWEEMTPSQRGRERARQQSSYPGTQKSFGQRSQAASKALSSAKKFKAFKQGSERKTKARGYGRGEDFGLSSRHAPQKDQNRQRRDDWGERGGGEIISTRNILICLALGFIVLYVLSKTSPSDLGL